jgi:PAS domain S-box-containing protein
MLSPLASKYKLGSPVRRMHVAMLCAATLVLVAMAALAYREWQQFRLIQEDAIHAAAVEDAIDRLLDRVLDAETGQRGYLLTGRDRYLEPYNQAAPAVLALLARLNELLAPAPELTQLSQQVNEKMAELRQTIELRKQQGAVPAMEVVLSDRGKDTMDRIRALCSQLGRQQQTRRTAVRAEALVITRTSMLVTALGSLFLLALLIAGDLAIGRVTVARERALEDARTARESLQTTLISIGDGVIATDTKGRIVFANPVAQKILRSSEAQLIGRNLEEAFRIVNEDTRARVESPVAKVLREGVIAGLANHTILIARDGTEIPIDDSGAPICGKDGTVHGAVLVFRDISERRRSEAALESANLKLTRANEDLQRFAFIASHDLQEPLRMITTYSQLLARGRAGELGEEARGFVDNVVEAARRMRELLSDLLAYTELGSDSTQPAEIIDLNLMVQNATDNLKVAIQESGAVVDCDPLPEIRAHAAHMISLLQNLIGNAIKYRGEQPPRIRIFVERRDDGLRFGVADNGIGIDPPYHAQIFEVFKRLHVKKAPGTGVGLAICQRIAQRYRGRIWVESRVGEGATFYFTLPDAVNRGAGF